MTTRSRLTEPIPLSSKSAKYRRRKQDWDVTAGFRTMPRRSLPINTYYDIQDQPWQSPFMQRWIRKSDGFVGYDWPPGSLTHTGEQVLAERQALYTSSGFESMAERVADETYGRMLSKISDAKVNLAVAVAEAKKTADLIYSTASRVDRAYRALRKGNLRQVASILGISASKGHSTWLEYKYGWMPLLMDVRAGAEFFAQQVMGGRPLAFTVSAKGEGAVFLDGGKVPYTAYGSPSGGLTSYYQATFTGHYECRKKVWLEVVNPNLTTVQQLGMTNPALVAWELVPYSFVLDWFISVGDYLQGLTAMNGLRVVKAFHSNTNSFEYKHVQPATRFDSGSFVFDQNSRDRGSDDRHHARYPMTVDGPKIPRVENPFSLHNHKLATSLALIRARHR